MNSRISKNNPIDIAFSFIFSNYKPGCFNTREIQFLSSFLAPQMPSIIHRQIRLSFQLLSTFLPVSWRLSLLKLIREVRKITATKIKEPRDCIINKKVIELDKLGFKRRKYKQFKAVVCLTYDIDRKVCYNYLDKLIDILCKYNLTATLNILTAGEYKIKWAKIENIKNLGFEIGLHGATHDIALGYRNIGYIRLELKNALANIPFKVYGYRAPALCMTPTLLQVITELGFLYDSSLPMTNMYYKSVESCFPYPLNNKVWEFPVTIQDNTFFLDLKLSQKEALKKLISIIEAIKLLGGISIINLHPYIIINKLAFHYKLLTYLKEQKDILICTMKDLYDYIQSVIQNSDNL